MLPIACNVQRLEDTMRECWDDTTLESQLMTAFMRFQRTRRKAPLHEKFNRSEVMLIGAIMHLQMESEEPVTVSRLSQKLRVATPTVTKLLSAMEEKGIVERTVSRRDRRKIIVSFTEAGLEMGKKAQEHFMQDLSNLVALLGEEDTRSLIRILDKVAEDHDKRTEVGEVD